jgi:hypothetical protein
VVLGGLVALVAAQVLDDVLQFSLQRPVEQVSLLPFPNRVKSVALATLGGVLRPLSKASAGGVALALGPRSALLPIVTVGAAVGAIITYSQHRRRYLVALESADASATNGSCPSADKSTPSSCSPRRCSVSYPVNRCGRGSSVFSITPFPK